MDIVSYAYPLILDVRDRPVVIVGGGPVAARKVAGLLAAGARRIRVVSPEFCAELPQHSDVRRIVEPYHTRHLDGAQLVIAATNVRHVNDAVVRDARQQNVLVQRVDGQDDPPGDFTTPAVHRDGAVLIAVSTGGHPPLAAMIRDRLAGQIDPIWTEMADALMHIRAEMLDRLAPDQRRDVFRRAATAQAMDVLRARGREGLKKWLMGSA